MSATRIVIVLAWVALGVSTAVAQSADQLPGELSGKWTASTPRGTFIDAVSFTFDGNGQPGPVTGKVTFRGVNCGALDEPLKGSWDGWTDGYVQFCFNGV